MNSFFGFLGLLAALLLMVTLLYIYLEKKKKQELKKKFRKYSENYKLSQKDLRAVPRIGIPSTMEIQLALTDEDFFGLKAYALDMSLSGFSVRPTFPLKKLPIAAQIHNVLVTTPINSFAVKTMRTVRIEHQLDKRLMAFHIEDIDGDQFELLKTFMAYLYNFLKDDED